MGFNSAFKGLIARLVKILSISFALLNVPKYPGLWF